MFYVVASHVMTGVILLIEWSQSNISFSPVYLSPFSEWFKLQKEPKFHRYSCKDIWDAENSGLNSLVSDRPLKTHRFQHMSRPHEPTGMHSCSITCLYCARCDHLLSVSSNKWEIIVHQNSVGVKNQLIMVSSPDLSEWALITSNA